MGTNVRKLQIKTSQLGGHVGVASAALIAASMWAPSATAQEAPSADEALATDIVVTANKREERVSRVGGSVVAVSGAKLEERSATSLQDYLALIPGISIQSQGAAGWGVVQIRGVSSQNVSAATATYIDEIPVGASSSTVRSNFYTVDLDPADLERVEVLKGPQGTLYGASSMGGVIKYVTRRPSLTDTEIRASEDFYVVEGGDIGTKLRASLSTPLVEGKAAVRVSGYYRRDAGYIDNLQLGRRDINKGDAWGVRGSLFFKPVETVSVALTGLYQQSKYGGLAVIDLDQNTLEPRDRDLSQRRYVPEPFSAKNLLLSAEIKWESGAGTLISATSFSQSRPKDSTDFTEYYNGFFGVALDNPFSNNGRRHATDKITQELRFNSSRLGAVEFIVGGYYTHEKLSDVQAYEFMGPDFRPDPTQDPLGLAERNGQLDEYAAFVNATVYLSEDFDLTGGYRHARIDQQGTRRDSGLLFGESASAYSISEDADTFLAGLRWRATDNILFYARAASGYRPGASRGVPPGAPPGFADFYTSDSLWSYEAGVKATGLNGRFSAELSGFWIDWSDIQTLIPIDMVIVSGNAGTARSRGFEALASYMPVRGLTLSGNVSYTDSRFTEDNAATGVLDGDRLYYVPKWRALASADYNFAVGNLDATIGGEVSYTSNVLDLTRFPLPSYTMIGLHAGIKKDNLSVNFYVKNLTNRRAWTGSSGYYPDFFYQPSIVQPRTLGVTFSQKF
ncbi:TonB-dependent receptor [Sphingopyxis sp. JAI128]|uniref:TonB-dependent receptor n=1 Tax=Sphingopyxis sp. JAI128 TaxID=2723066 RepID=UPI00161D8B38|nr:TonB-dependent receptor [Sphingopyxis sp. JAI128]MBB6427907.1 outer membrane receptor protein involved in Fe transport [Sphingopyxis sp. JAI128]